MDINNNVKYRRTGETTKKKIKRIFYCIEKECDKIVCGLNRRCNKHAMRERFSRPEERKKRSERQIGNKNSFYGKHHTEESKRKISKNHDYSHMRGRNNPNFVKPMGRFWGMYKNIKMRSTYEILYAKYLDDDNIKWKYESKTFDLGNTTYTPDFYLPKTNEYIDTKGWFTKYAKKKFGKFKKLYSNIILKIIYKKDLIKLGISVTPYNLNKIKETYKINTLNTSINKEK